MTEVAQFEVLGKKDTRSGFGEGLLEIGKRNKNVVGLCADLTGSLKMNAFKDECPDRFKIFNVGRVYAGVGVQLDICVIRKVCKKVFVLIILVQILIYPDYDLRRIVIF